MTWKTCKPSSITLKTQDMIQVKHAFLLALPLALALGRPATANAQAAEIQQLLLNVEKLEQFRNILTDMKKGYDILQHGYGAVRDIAAGSFALHETFLDGLLAVNPALREYSRVADILSCQQAILREYRDAYRRFSRSGSFSPEELIYIGQVYENLSSESLQHLEELALVLTAGELRMADDERLAAIDNLYREASDKLTFLRHFNRQATLLAIQRERELHSIHGVQRQSQGQE